MSYPSPDAVPCMFGPYRLQGVLGRGPASTVYLAVQAGSESADGVVRRALHVPHATLLGDATFAEAFLGSARQAEPVRHAGLVRIREIDTIDGVPVVAMDVLQGGPLSRVVDADVLDPAHMLDVGLAMAEAIDAVHRGGLVHGHLDASRVFLTRGGEVVLLGLGLSKLIRARPDVCEARHLAPEVLHGAAPDARSDLFALGAVLAEAALREPMWAAETDAERIAERDRIDEIVAQRRLQERIRESVPGLGLVIAGLLRHDPQARIGTAREVMRQLERVRKSLPWQVLPDGGLRERIRDWAGGSTFSPPDAISSQGVEFDTADAPTEYGPRLGSALRRAASGAPTPRPVSAAFTRGASAPAAGAEAAPPLAEVRAHRGPWWALGLLVLVVVVAVGAAAFALAS